MTSWIIFTIFWSGDCFFGIQFGIDFQNSNKTSNKQIIDENAHIFELVEFALSLIYRFPWSEKTNPEDDDSENGSIATFGSLMSVNEEMKLKKPKFGKDKFDIIRRVIRNSNGLPIPTPSFWIGLNKGGIIAGILDRSLPSFDAYSNTVNLASRCEKLGKPGRIQCTLAIKSVLESSDRYVFEKNKKVNVKGFGELDLFFVDEIEKQIQDNNIVECDLDCTKDENHREIVEMFDTIFIQDNITDPSNPSPNNDALTSNVPTRYPLFTTSNCNLKNK